MEEANNLDAASISYKKRPHLPNSFTTEERWTASSNFQIIKHKNYRQKKAMNYP